MNQRKHISPLGEVEGKDASHACGGKYGDCAGGERHRAVESMATLGRECSSTTVTTVQQPYSVMPTAPLPRSRHKAGYTTAQPSILDLAPNCHITSPPLEAHRP
eukprot:PhM_4_TR10041/c3_g1_i14/m.99255